ncbi:MAG: hypothetical protein V2A73_16700, partial [Pseudomonadota bacterium]
MAEVVSILTVEDVHLQQYPWDSESTIPAGSMRLIGPYGLVRSAAEQATGNNATGDRQCRRRAFRH